MQKGERQFNFVHSPHQKRAITEHNEVDETICAIAPEHFYGVGQFYEDFSQTTDEEVRELLAAAAKESRSSP
jgi:predicted phosphoribosyltransferase